MTITHITNFAGMAAQYGDARRPENGLPWQSEKLGVSVFVSDQSGCVFLIVRHDPVQPPSRLVRTFFRDAPDATVAVVACSGEEERTALLAPIQSTIAASLEDSNQNKISSSATVIDLYAPSTRRHSRSGKTGASNRPYEWIPHAIELYYFDTRDEFHQRFQELRLPSSDGLLRPAEAPAVVLRASEHGKEYVLLIRVYLERSRKYSVVRELFKPFPDAYGWAVEFDNSLLSDIFALGLQHRIYGSQPDEDDRDEDFRWPDGNGDSGVPAVTIRPAPTRSGSAAAEIPEEEPEFFFIGPTELAETPIERELVPARVTR